MTIDEKRKNIYFAGNSLASSNLMMFTTKDLDHDKTSMNCAHGRHGAWWFNNCGFSHLNGEYLPRQTNTRGVRWYQWGNSNKSLKFAEMKMRPKA